MGFVIIEPENLKFKHETTKNKKTPFIIKNTVQVEDPKRQREGFLNHYDFAYAGRDTVNQAAKVTPGVIKAVTNDINNIAEQRINQIISKGGSKVERVLTKILRGAIKDVYQTPIWLLGNFGKQQFNKIKRKILR